jgi:hypothetical protein
MYSRPVSNEREQPYKFGVSDKKAMDARKAFDRCIIPKCI